MKLLSLITFVLICLLFNSCSNIAEDDLEGRWVILHMVDSNGEVFPNSKSPKVSLLPPSISSKEVIEFSRMDNDVKMPGINTKDIMFKWEISRDSLKLSVDTSALKLQYAPKVRRTVAFSHLVLQDSLSQVKDVIKFYSGKYKMKRFKQGIELIAADKGIMLVNYDMAMNNRIEELLTH